VIRVRLLSLLAACACFAVTAMAAPPMKAYAASDFVDSVGVNTHLRYGGTYYDTNFPELKQRLLAAHLLHIRDGAMDLDGDFYPRDAAPRFAELGRAGIRATFVFRPMVPRDFVQGWPARVAPAFEAYELPNEQNLQKSLPWVETLRIWLPLFAGYVRGNAPTANYPIVGPSIADIGGFPFLALGDQQKNLDFGNLHKYYRAFNPGTVGYGSVGKPPCDKLRYGALAYAQCEVERVSGAKPVMVTEGGYATGVTPGREVTPEIQARYLARMLLLHFKAGIRRTFIYQFADSGTDSGHNFGLIDSEGTPKPSYLQIAGLLGEISDVKAAGSPRPLELDLTGELDNVESALFAKADGSYRLVLWIETRSVDPNSGQIVDVPNQRVRLALPSELRTRRVMTFESSGAPRVRTLAAGVTELNITDNLTIVDFARKGS
jgi:hypothetical protein